MKIFITGSSSGIGEQLAYSYSYKKVTIGLAARRIDRLNIVADKCRELGATVYIYKLDVNDRKESKLAINKFIEQAGGIEILIANAGIANHDHLKTGDSKIINNILHTNILGVTNSVLPVIPHMKNNKNGKIVIISSIASFMSIIHHGGYSASKIAVKTLANSWRKSLKKYNIQITTIMPGFIKSEMTNQSDIKMPFLMDTSLAATKIVNAVNTGKRNYIFPWQWRYLIPLMKWIY